MRPAFTPRDIATSVTSGVLVLAMTIWGLWSLATPAHMADRLGAVQGKLAALDRVRAGRGDVGLYPPGSICPRADDAGLNSLKTMVQADAAKAGVILSAARMTPALAGVSDLVTPVEVSFEARGGEANIRRFFSRLANLHPLVFTDALDLKSDGPQTSLLLKGRVFCANRLR